MVCSKYGPMTKASILLVDDEKSLLALLIKYLQRAGYAVESCESGREAIERCRQSPCPFQIVVLDLQLPDMKGEDVFFELLKANPDVRVLISSGRVWLPDDLSAEDRLRVSFMLKPYMPRQLQEEIESLLER